MSKVKIRAIVLSARPHKEKDRIIKLLSPEVGVVSACANGAAKINGKHSCSTRAGTLSEFVLTDSKGFFYVSESDLITSFSGIEQSIEGLTALAHILEVAQDAAMDSSSSKMIYELLVYSIHALSKNKDYRLVVSAFEFRLMDIIGYPLTFESAHLEDDLEKSTFSFESCQFCPSDRLNDGRSITLTSGCIRALIYIREASLDRLFSFSASDSVLELLSTFTRQYLCERLDSKYCKLDMLDYI